MHSNFRANGGQMGSGILRKFHCELQKDFKGVSRRCLMKMKLKLDATTREPYNLTRLREQQVERDVKEDKRQSRQAPRFEKGYLCDNILLSRKNSKKSNKKGSLKRRTAKENENPEEMDSNSKESEQKCSEDSPRKSLNENKSPNKSPTKISQKKHLNLPEEVLENSTAEKSPKTITGKSPKNSTAKKSAENSPEKSTTNSPRKTPNNTPIKTQGKSQNTNPHTQQSLTQLEKSPLKPALKSQLSEEFQHPNTYSRKCKQLKARPQPFGQQKIFKIFGYKFSTLRAFEQRKKLRNFVLRNTMPHPQPAHTHRPTESWGYKSFDFSYACVVMLQQLLLLLVLMAMLAFVQGQVGGAAGDNSPAMAATNGNGDNNRQEDYTADKPAVTAVTNDDENKGTNSNNLYKQPHFRNEHSNVMVHLFEWKFADIAKECVEFLGPHGYAGVQLSPVSEHLLVQTDRLQRPWWERYQPVSYQIASRSGSEDELRDMLQQCNAAGVRVYVEVVLNHMAGGGVGDQAAVGSGGSEFNVTTLSYPAVPYQSADFHRTSCLAVDGSSLAEDIRNCRLDGHPDLDHKRASVRQAIVQFLDNLIGMGVAGFQVHAAKHMWPKDLELIFGELQDLNSEDFDFPAGSRPLIYMDVLDIGSDSISKTEYSNSGLVSEYLYAAELSTILGGKVPLSSLINWGPAMGFLPHQDSYVFIDTPFAQRGMLPALGSNQLITYRLQQKYLMANLFMMAHPYGRVKRIQSSFYFPSKEVDQGPPTDPEAEDIRSPVFDANGQCTRESGWVCEHRWPALLKMLQLVNSLDDAQDTLTHFQTFGPNHIAFCRGHRAFVALNNDMDRMYETQVNTCLPEGIYCDVISGGVTEDGSDCHGTSVAVDNEGNANIRLSVADVSSGELLGNDLVNIGVLAIYEGSKLSGSSIGASISEDEIDPSLDVEVLGDGEDVADLAEAEEAMGNEDEEEEEAESPKEEAEAEAIIEAVEEDFQFVSLPTEEVEIVSDI